MRNPWVAIMRAADRGTGLHLTPYEVHLLACDSAIEQCAFNDVVRVDETIDPSRTGWFDVDPKKYPVNPTLAMTSTNLKTPPQTTNQGD